MILNLHVEESFISATTCTSWWMMGCSILDSPYLLRNYLSRLHWAKNELVTGSLRYKLSLGFCASVNNNIYRLSYICRIQTFIVRKQIKREENKFCLKICTLLQVSSRKKNQPYAKIGSYVPVYTYICYHIPY